MPGRLLIVAAEFPPVKGIGRLRPLKFCLHLPRYGWETAVLAPEEGAIEPVDTSTLREIPSCTQVFRAPLPRPKERVVGYAKSMLAGRESSASKTQSADPMPPIARNGKRHGRLAWAGHVLGAWDAFARKYLLIPDDIVLWSGPAVEKGMDAIRRFKPDVILATAPHFTDFIIGARLSRLSGIPWIADYRDLWTGDVLRDWVPPWRRRLELEMERRYVSTASAVVTVSEPKTEVVRTRLGKDCAATFTTLTNGYDIEEFASVLPERGQPDTFRIVYTGRLFKNRRGYELIEAAGQLLERYNEYRTRLRIEYYGGVAPEISVRMQALIDRYSLASVVSFFPDVSYERSKALQKGADALLLIVDVGETTSGVIPGKLFEYIAAGHPILCIAAPGATPDIIERGRLGVVARPGDVGALASALRSLLDYRGFVFDPDSQFVAQFERGALVQRLSVILEDVKQRSHSTQRP